MSGNGPLRTTIEREGQAYFDKPVYSQPNPIADGVSKALSGKVLPRDLIAYERYPLDWTKPKGQTCPSS